METMNFGEPKASQGGENNQAPRSGGARNKKLIWAGVVLAVLILAIGGWQYWQYTHSVYYQQIKAVKLLETMEKESDKWGGKTPEETVRLFAEAVKKGDFDLASKYGVSSLESEIKSTLEEYKNSEYWDDYLIWLENLKNSISPNQNFGPNSSTYESFDDNGRRVIFISLAKNEGGIWKINEF